MGDINYGVQSGIIVGVTLGAALMMISVMLIIDVMEEENENATEEANAMAAITKAKPLTQSPEIVHYLSVMGGNASVPRRRKNRTRSSKRV